MARNGSGTYVLPSGNPVVTGTTISSTWANTTLSDIATALTNSIAKDGQTIPTANLPMGTFKHTGVAVAASTTDYARADQVQNGSLVYLTGISGADTIIASAAISLAAYATGQKFHFVSAGANTGAATLNINNIGAKAITKNGATALVAGEIANGAACEVIYDGTQFQLVSLTKIGISANNLVQLNASGQYPAASGELVTGINTSGQCVLSYVSGTAIKLSPKNGNRIIIAGSPYAIPSAGISSGNPATASNFLNGVANQTLAASTLYYVYAFNNSGTLALDFSTTGHSADTTAGNIGVEIKTGDNSRTLVGMVYTNATPAFTSVLVRSWFNDPGCVQRTSFSSSPSTASTASQVELDTSIRNNVLLWSGETFRADLNYGTINNTASQYCYTAIRADGNAMSVTAQTFQVSGTGWYQQSYVSHDGAPGELAEGLHQFSVYGQVSGGTGSWLYTSAGAAVLTLHAYGNKS